MRQQDHPGQVSPGRLEAGLKVAFGRAGGEESVLEVASRIAGGQIGLLLPDALENDTPTPLTEALAGDGETPAPTRGSYHVLGRLGGGGMGEVLKAHDLELGRDVALKVLRAEHGRDPRLLRRFVEEAQVGGQLQHPGIVPVYELGLMADQRPYFTMKLVKGRTLAALLKARRDPGEERRRFLSIFEDVCQTVAYAHSRGVIHRDLKPSNVMVGAFGEVQVVDWGLAKILRKGDRRRPRVRHDGDSTRVETLRSRPGSKEADSVHGSVIGTPVCMPPEQARGEVERLDERADVFALGAILAQVLTGRSLYRGSGEEMLAQAVRAELGPIREALAQCGAEPELVAVCGECLTVDPEDRPADAGVVARRLHDHLEAIEERARTAQIEAAEARVRAAAERRARKLTVGLAASVLVTVLAVGGGSAWLALKRAESHREQLAQVDEELDKASLALGLEQWSEALSAAGHALEQAEQGGERPELAVRIEAAQAILSTAREAARLEALDEENRTLLAALRELRQPEGDAIYPTDWARLDAAFAALFADHALVVEGASAGEAVESIRARGIPVELAAALDEWALVRRKAQDPEGAARLWLLADRLDTDEDRVALRRAIRTGDVETLKAEAEELSDDRPVGTLLLLARSLGGVGAHDEAVAVYRHGLLQWPDEFALHVGLARRLAETEPEQAVGHYTAALALDEDSVEVRHEMGIVLENELGDRERACKLFHASAELMPGDAHLQLHLAWHEMKHGSPPRAMESARRAVDLDPDSGLAHLTLGRLQEELGEPDQAIESYLLAVEVAPDLAEAHNLLGRALLRPSWARPNEADEAEIKRAILHFERALELNRELLFARRWLAYALLLRGRHQEAIEQLEADRGWGSVWDRSLLAPGQTASSSLAAELAEYEQTLDSPTEADYQSGTEEALAMVLTLALRFEEAVEAARAAVERNPANAGAWAELGRALTYSGQPEEALAAFDQAIDLDSTVAARSGETIGRAYWGMGRLEEALAAFDRHLEVHADCGVPLYSRGIILFTQGRLEEAESSYRRALDVDPNGLVLGALGQVLGLLGEYEEAVDCFLRAIEVAGGSSGDSWWLRCEYAWILVHAADGFYRDLDEAEHQARLALVESPPHPVTTLTLGLVLYRRGLHADARELLESGLETAEKRSMSMTLEWYGFYLAMAQHACGDREAARQTFDRTARALEELWPVPDLVRLREEAARVLGVELMDVDGSSESDG